VDDKRKARLGSRVEHPGLSMFVGDRGGPPIGMPSRSAHARCHDQAVAESPIDTLVRWEAHGAVWRAESVTETEAVVDLFTCGGELVDRLRFEYPAVLRYLAARPRSDAD
jgi:hypothetical protein